MPPSTHSIGSTESFIKEIENFYLEPGDVMVSFDVVDLYPSIDTKKISEFINERIKFFYGNDKISETLIKTSNLLFNEAYFQFNGKFYKQMKGVLMGSSISGYAAEINLRNLENNLEENIEKHIKLRIRYVDDIFAVLKPTGNPHSLLEEINKIDANIKFTLEIEENNTLSFLDVKIFKENDHFETRVFW